MGKSTAIRIFAVGLVLSLPTGLALAAGTKSDSKVPSADAKFVNLSTNIGSICLFAITGKIIYAIALPMAVFNAAGGFLGSKLAILRGNTFIRIIFLCVVSATLLRLAYEYLLK